MLATRALFSLTHKYGDILREGWRNMTECLLQLFKCQLLPDTMMEAEDFLEPSGVVSLVREELPVEKEDSGLINWYRIEHPFENAKPEDKFVTIFDDIHKQYNFKA